MKYIVLMLISVIISSCGYNSYEDTEKIIGQWNAKSFIFKGKTYSMTKTKFDLNFSKDFTYSLESELTKLFNDKHYNSIPFRGEGTFNGDYAIVSDGKLWLKEKYRDKISFNTSISNNELSLLYIGIGTDNIKIILTKTLKDE